MNVMQRVQGNKRWHTIDMLKGLAIICVILSHVQLTGAERLALLAPFWMWMAVPVFMVLIGFNYASSAEKVLQQHAQWFERDFFIRKLTRYLYPFLIAEMVEICWMLYRKVPLHSMIRSVLSGGCGPGGYYNSMLFQLLVLFPLLYSAMQRRRQMLWGLILLNLGYELICTLLKVSDAFYRLCIFRYIGALAVGIAVWQHRDMLMEKSRENRSLLPETMTLMGIVFLYATCYGGYQRVLFLKWHNTSLYSIPLAFGIIVLTMRCETSVSRFVLNLLTPLRYLGKASYHVFLTQMIYFNFPLSKMIYERIGGGWNGTLLSIIIDCAICVSIGCIFYQLMQNVSSRRKLASKRQ